MAKNPKKNFELVRQFALVVILLLEIVIFTILSDKFMTGSNIINVFRQVSFTGISAVGMFMIILLGDIDLSVGSLYALIGVLCAYTFKATASIELTILLALGLGTVIGAFNGIITSRFKIPAFVTTLASMSICKGIAYILTNGRSIGVVDSRFTYLGSGYMFGVIPVPVISMIIVFALGFFVMEFTRFGRHVYACGGNYTAARWSGLKTSSIKTIVFIIAGLLNGFAALTLAGRLGGGLPTAGDGAEMDVITAVVLGGTSMTGGRGKLWGVITGVMIIGILTNGLTMIYISTYWQQVIKGIIIVAAVIMDTRNAE